jgi:hypothetical protein
VGIVRACDEGLQALAVQCAAVSARLASHPPTPTPGPAAQATSAAVSDANGVLARTRSALSARVGATGAKLNLSGARYATQEKNSAHRLDALSPTVEA